MQRQHKRKQMADTDCTKRIRVESLNLPALRRLFDTRMQEDFPELELKPFPKMQELYETGHYLPLAIRENSEKQEMLAYALFAREKAEKGHHYLLDYFAVKKSERGSGIGTDFLREMEVHIDDAESILGEIEDPDHAVDDEEEAVRLRRRAFYLRNGVRETCVRARVCGMNYRILEAGGSMQHSTAEVQHILRRFYRRFFPEKMYREEVSVHIA